ncbi:response regulator receiver [Catenovulum agarivorans DS-2]|uniref:Response regulator receiver n=1 Tax=Catenovulum agarivorans DS-2 TaxID=1328313 RepID=W7QKN1_9ALTE|nr:response regulator [Catenovulum agarivorans]EWH09517.1 response regulator receiver [Catenovulum agarivorans DS-2]
MNQELIKHANVLIIDDQALAQVFLKQSLEKLGFDKIMVAESAKHALRLAEEHQFNVIICSFNLSRDKDGYQLFEELKAKGAIKLTTTFIFTSAETDAALVNSVVELQPDDFLAKPFTAKELSDRLRRVLTRKHTLTKVYRALEQNNYAAVLEQVDTLLMDPKAANLYPLLMRIKGDALLASQQYQQAAQFYYEIITLQKFTWAMVGLAKAYLGLDKEDAAINILEKLVAKPQTRLAALDLLGQYYIQHDEYELAYQKLQNASELSPRNIDRHKSVVQLARLVHDHSGQYNAAKAMLKYAKRSFHETADLYLTVARSGIDYALTLPEQESAVIVRQSEKFLEALKDQFPSSAENKDKISIVQARIHYLKDEESKAKQLVSNILEHEESGNLEDYIDKAKAFHELGYQDQAIHLLENIHQQYNEDNTVNDKVLAAYLTQEKSEKTEIPFTPRQLNNIAVQLYGKKQYPAAIQAFADALRLMPKNVRIALNMLQALVDQMVRTALDEQQTKLYNSAISIISQQNLPHDQQTRYEKLLERSAQAKERHNQIDQT